MSAPRGGEFGLGTDFDTALIVLGCSALVLSLGRHGCVSS